jgi:hypothetical protein
MKRSKVAFASRAVSSSKAPEIARLLTGSTVT